MPKAKSEKPTIETFTRLIEKKREGNEYTDEEIRSIVDAILDEEMPEYQQAAWVMTTFFQGMSAQEIANFHRGDDAFGRSDRNDGCFAS